MTLYFINSLISRKSYSALFVLMLMTSLAFSQDKEINVYFKLKSTNNTLGISTGHHIAIEDIRKMSEVRHLKNVVKESTNPGLLSQISIHRLRELYKVRVTGDVNDFIQKLESYDNVVYAEPEPKEMLLFVPNDPNRNSQSHLDVIHAYEAWDVTTGNVNIVVAISDNGLDITHTDLAANWYQNVSDPVNGLDDDNNGYIDDFEGYDLADNDRDVNGDINTHGSMVTGISSAATNNSIGIAGIGYQSKFYPIKVFESSTGQSSGTYESIIYAADLGFDVINLSWGSEGTFSNALQDIINYAVLDKNVVVVAAAGNTDADLDFYPASYQHVLSVGATDYSDKKASFSTYSHHIDLMAPGVLIYSTLNGGGYGGDSGTSFSAPMVSATAALVKDVFPQFNAIQIMEQIRVTSDDIYNVGNNSNYYGKLGHGRLNVFRSVSEKNHAAIRIKDLSYTTSVGQGLFYGDTIVVNITFSNILRNVSNAQVSLSSESTFAQILTGGITLGDLNSLENSETFFVKMLLSEKTPPSLKMSFRLDYLDEVGYTDFEYFDLKSSPNYIDFENPKIALTVASNGNLGYESDNLENGLGLVYQGEQIADVMGLMIGNHVDSISDNLINDYTTLTYENDFKITRNIKFRNREDVDQYARGVFSDSLAVHSQGLLIEQEYLGWDDAANQDFLIAEYFVTNMTGVDKSDMKLGVYADFNLADQKANFAAWDATNQLAYTYSMDDNQMIGMALISAQTSYMHAIDLFDQADAPIDFTGGFTEIDKLNLLNTEKTTAGDILGNDVAQLLVVDLQDLLAKSSQKVAIVYVFGNSLSELIQNMDKAKIKYQSFVQAPDLNKSVFACKDVAIDLDSENIALFSDALGLNEVARGARITLDGFDSDTLFYYQTIKNGYRSDLYQLYVKISDVVVDYTTDPDTLLLEEGVSESVSFFSEIEGAISWHWDFGNGNLSLLQNPKNLYNAVGDYQVSLEVVTTGNCKDKVVKTFLVVQRSPLPVVQDLLICEGTSAVIQATNTTAIRIYKNSNDAVPIYEGDIFTSGPLSEETQYFVTSMSETVESTKVPVLISIDIVSAGFSFTPDSLNLSSSQIIAISDKSKNAISLSWKVNDANRGSASDLVVEYFGTTTIKIQQTATSAFGCKHTFAENVNFSKSAAPVIVDQTICRGTETSFVANNNEHLIVYESSTKQKIIGKGHQVFVGPVEADRDFFVTNVNQYLESDLRTVHVAVSAIEANILSNPDSLAWRANQNVTFSVSNEEIVSYRWFVNDVLYEIVPSPTLKIDSVGDYAISLAYMDVNGCPDTLRTIFKAYSLLGIDGWTWNDVSLYPNPTSDELNLTFSQGANISEPFVFGIDGKKILLPYTTNPSTINIKTTSLKTGLYVLNLRIEGQQMHFKFIKN